MKVKLKKESPFNLKVGQEVESYEDDNFGLFLPFSGGDKVVYVSLRVMNRMIREGWFEEVKEEESLTDKIQRYIWDKKKQKYDLDYHLMPEGIAQIAESHHFNEAKIQEATYILNNRTGGSNSYNRDDMNKIISIFKGDSCN